LYPVPSSGSLSSTQSSSKTFFLLPGQSSNSQTRPYTTADGSVIRTSCSTTHYRSYTPFTGTADYDCAVVITGLSLFDHFYAILTPIYGQADIKIKANNSSNVALSFLNVQSLIDVTGKSGGLSRRLQARANISGGGSIDPIDNAIPDMALRTANVICKRLNVGSTVVSVGATTACNLSISGPT
jgi:hypothetical protein